MDIHSRIKLVVKWLIGTGTAETQEAIGKIMGYSNKSSFSQILNNKVPIPDSFIDKLCALNPDINKKWVTHGDGNMIVDFMETSENNDVKAISNSESIIYQMYKDLIMITKEKDAKIEELTMQMMKMAEEIGMLKSQVMQYNTLKEIPPLSNRFTEPNTPLKKKYSKIQK